MYVFCFCSRLSDEAREVGGSRNRQQTVEILCVRTRVCVLSTLANVFFYSSLLTSTKRGRWKGVEIGGVRVSAFAD